MNRMFYKLAKPNGYDFWTGKTINYREAIGCKVAPPKADPKAGLCSPGLIHASDEPNKCFIGSQIPCSAYLVMGKPIASDDQKHGFIELEVLEEIPQEHLDALFGWRYHEACNPVSPFSMPKRTPTADDIALLGVWASVRGNILDSVLDSVPNSKWAYAWSSVRDNVMDNMGMLNMWAYIGNSMSVSLRDSILAYIGSMFPEISEWKHLDHEPGVYPFASAATLWRRGLVPSFNGKLWRLHSGKGMEVVWMDIGNLIDHYTKVLELALQLAYGQEDAAKLAEAQAALALASAAKLMIEGK